MVSRRGPGHGVRRAEVRRAGRKLDPKAHRRQAASALTRSSNGHPKREMSISHRGHGFQGQFKAYTDPAPDGQANDRRGHTGPLIVAWRDGAPGPSFRISVASVTDSVEERQDASAWYNTVPRGIVLAVQKQPGTNTIEVVDSDQGASSEFPGPANARLDESLEVLYDRSTVNPCLG